MARLFYTGWESGGTETNGGEFRSVGYNLGPVSVQKRTGTYSLRSQSGTTGGGSAYVVQVFDTEPNHIYFRVAFRHDFPGSGSDTYTKLVSFHESGYEQFGIGMSKETLMLGLYVNGTILVDTGSIPITASTWYMIEGEAFIDNTNGTIIVKTNATTDLTYAGTPTNFGIDSTITTMRIGAQNHLGGAYTFWLDDVAVNDDTGDYQNSWIGLGGVFYLEPTADGDQNDWTPSAGSDNYAMVDDIPSDNATTYVQALDSGDIDLYEVDDCPQYIAVINCLEVAYRAALATSGYNELTDLVKVSGSVYQGTEHVIVPITPSFAYYLGTIHYLNPYTGSAWGTAEVNAMQAGIEITV